ncbi:MAG: geranylgeranyl reductase family protein [Archaeoglobaceae archaeon]|nr:geranylgeranyl reductase family protein [Archaeoglobaceae archaeon]MDW7989363.1 geranylgeranyl reductase family protein [Archaeoglobaceae archaeon]
MDVIVAGLGIAGVFALRSLSKSLDVVGIDKREKLGHPVKCGEIIPTKKEMKRLLPELGDYSLFDISKRFESNKTDVISFFFPNGKSYDINFEFHVVNRDKMIQKIAKDSGHKIEREVILDYKNGRLYTNKGIREAKILIASDGANSRIAKSLGLWNYEISSAKQFVMRNVECDYRTVYMFIGKEISPGAYGWIIPKGNGFANVGVGFRSKFSNESVHRVLERFVKEFPYSFQFLKRAEVVSKVGAIVPIDKPLERAVHGNVIFAGDSASMIISHTGGGIPISMVAGNLAGEVVNKFFFENGKLEEYDLLLKKFLKKPLLTAFFFRRLWDLFADKEEKILKIMKLTNARDLEKILHCEIPWKIKLLYPFLKLII